MAPPGKKGKKKRGQTLDLNAFLQNDKDQSGGKAVVISKTGNSWADHMDAFDSQMEKTVVLPTAPSSVRGGMSFDVDRIPANGPYKVFLANVSYDADETLIAGMFEGLDVVSVHLPLDDGGRFKGFGYVEFGNRDDLIEALQMEDLEVAGRKLRIDLKTPSERDQQRGYSSFGRSEGDSGADSSSDWRSGPRTEPSRDGPGYGGDRGGDRAGDRGGDRAGERGGFGSDRGGFGGDRGGFGDRGGRGGDREPTMASKPGSKYDSVPAFSDYARGSDRGGFGGRDDRFGDRDRGRGYDYDRGGGGRAYGGRDDGYSSRDRGRGYDYDRGGGGRAYGGRDDGYSSRDRGRGYDYDRGGGGRAYGGRDDGYSSRGGDRDGPRYDSKDGPRDSWTRDGPRFESKDGPRYESKDGPRYESRDSGTAWVRDGPRFESKDGPRYESKDGPRYESKDGPRYESRDSGGAWVRDGPRYESKDGPRYESKDAPRYESRDGPRYDSRDGPRYDSRDGPRRDASADVSAGDAERPPASRPKLNLKPRSAPAEEIGKPAASSSIFGGAKPVDTTAREREVEERLKGGGRGPEREWERERPPPGSQRRAEASRDIRLSEPVKQQQDGEPERSGEETNGKTEGGERREREPRPPPKLEEKPADFAAPSRFSALSMDD